MAGQSKLRSGANPAKRPDVPKRVKFEVAATDPEAIARLHVNPVDGKSMNRFYPGREDGTQTERASFLMTREVVDQCDHLIDLHGGDLDENLRPYSYWTVTGNMSINNPLQTGSDPVTVFDLKHGVALDPLSGNAVLNGIPVTVTPSG